MSTNMPSNGAVVLEIAVQDFRRNCQILKGFDMELLNFLSFSFFGQISTCKTLKSIKHHEIYEFVSKISWNLQILTLRYIQAKEK